MMRVPPVSGRYARVGELLDVGARPDRCAIPHTLPPHGARVLQAAPVDGRRREEQRRRRIFLRRGGEGCVQRG
jgi:hypothetical protein